ncbi:MAG: endonuclease/exonuclease/phosphatase family protein [Candidatus Omnitrophota bacterium]
MNEKKQLKIRVMTYNVHSCRGLDGRVIPERIGQVIEKYSPDIVALQELDVNRKNTGKIDQPLSIANYLRMHCHFQPALAMEGEHYGIAVLSRYPFDLIKAGHLKSFPEKCLRLFHLPVLRHFFEPREIIWVHLKIEDREIHFFNTHLGLRAGERGRQIRNILSDEWLGSVNHEAAVVFCGDFNAGPKSAVYEMIGQQLKEAKAEIKNGELRKTFASRYPLFELDHIFYKGKIKLDSVEIPVTALTRTASDHLPVIADFIL